MIERQWRRNYHRHKKQSKGTEEEERGREGEVRGFLGKNGFGAPESGPLKPPPQRKCARGGKRETSELIPQLGGFMQTAAIHTALDSRLG